MSETLHDVRVFAIGILSGAMALAAAAVADPVVCSVWRSRRRAVCGLHGVVDEGISVRAIAEAIGRGLGLSTRASRPRAQPRISASWRPSRSWTTSPRHAVAGPPQAQGPGAKLATAPTGGAAAPSQGHGTGGRASTLGRKRTTGGDGVQRPPPRGQYRAVAGTPALELAASPSRTGTRRTAFRSKGWDDRR